MISLKVQNSYRAAGTYFNMVRTNLLVFTTRINIQTFLVVLTNWMKVLIFIHRKRLGLYQNDFGIDVLKFSTYVPRFCTTFN